MHLLLNAKKNLYKLFIKLFLFLIKVLNYKLSFLIFVVFISVTEWLLRVLRILLQEYFYFMQVLRIYCKSNGQVIARMAGKFY